MDELNSCINAINSNKDLFLSIHIKRFYHLLSQIPIDEIDNDNILLKIYDLIKHGTIRKDLMFIVLLVNSDKKVISRFIDYEKSLIKLDLTDSGLLYDYCLFTNKHWILDIAQNDTNYNDVFTQNTLEIFLYLQLIYRTNEQNINLKAIYDTLEKIQPSNNQFMNQYIQNLNKVLDVVQLCKKYLESENDSQVSEIYYYVSNNAILDVFSKFLDLRSFNVCEDILLKLNKYDAIIESEILTAFLVMHSILHCLQLCKNNIVNNDKDEISERIKETTLKLINMKNHTLQVEILENIFALMFLQGQLLTTTLERNTNFYCSEKEVRLILMFLKSVSDEIKRKNLMNKGADEFNRLTKLNKIIADGLWRLELIADSKISEKLQSNIIAYLLAPPETLIHLSLKQNNFNKADQVIQIFNLQDSKIASEINYNANFINLKQKLRKTFKMQQIKKENAEISMEIQSVGNAVDDFFKSNANVDDNCNFLNLIDLFVTLPMNFTESNELLEITSAYSNANSESQYFKFFKNILEVFREVNNRRSLSIKDILCDTQFDLNAEQCQIKEAFFSQLGHLCDIFYKQITYSMDGILNEKHPIHKTFIKLHQLFFSHYAYEGKEQIKYLQRLFNYLKGFSKVLYIEQNSSEIISHNKNTSFFEILKMSRSEILEKLIFEKNLDIGDFEQLFLKLKLDLVYHVAAIFFPNISLTTSKNDSLVERKPTRIPNSQIILYIQKRNWLLAYILNEMYNSDDFKLDLSEVRVKTFTNYLKLTSIQKLRPLYGNNQVIASLHHKVNLARLKSYIDEHTIQYEVEDFDHPNFLLASTESLETGEEIFEGGLRMTDWKHLFDIIDNIPQKDLFHNTELIKLRDIILTELIGDCFEIDYFKYAQLIIDDNLRCQCILNNYTTWPGDFCINIMKSELSRFSKIDEEYKAKLKELCLKIDFCEKIRKMLVKDTWFEVLLLCNEKPYEILHSLLNTVQIDLLLQFIGTFEVDTEMLETIDENYFVTLFDSSVNYSTIEELLQQLSMEHLTAICCNLLTMLKKLEHLNFIVNFMAIFNLTDDNNSTIRDIKISLKMISCFIPSEQEHLWCLVLDPSAIIEILIMNTKLEKLGEVLEKVKPYIENCEFDEGKLSIEKIDEILRCYAEKSLEFRVVLHSESKFVKSPESSKLLQSLDSLNFISTTKYFVMPETVPEKSEWVENYEVTECMCCMQTTFSMFNRRHHCRRCGRVICGACSLKRMQVPTYEDIPVRVCLDCFEQSHSDGAGTSSSKSEISIRSLGHDYWLLTNDAAHNQIVREEFSYEYAPSVSLCLAILKYHSKTEEYPKFLLNQCDGMLRLLQPVHSNSMEEIDYLLVIKMLKSLAVAAKMLSAQCMLQWGTSLADRILSQADLLGLLAERDCLHLIPTPTPNQICYIDANTLRRLRDKLLEREQWNLALEVSTKAGLDNTGVFAAWGKSYLKAGSLLKAREKFQRCFDKAVHYDTSTELSSSFSSMQLPHYRTKILTQLPENRPMKNPPLLNEILNILETNPTRIDPRILKDVKNFNMSSSTCSLNSSAATSMQNDPAIFILNKLKNLNRIIAGNYDAYADSAHSTSVLSVSKPYLEPLFYDECLYYLNKYGSHTSVLEFYIRHGRFYECLKYMLEHRLNSDHFIEIYILCLRENYVNAIHEAMSMIDSTLDIWKDYLKHICRYLEKQSNLNSLYQLQQFMGDFIRAALTCIKFYKDDAVTYTELTLRVDYLHRAQEHLQQELEQEQWVEVASVRKSTSDEQESFEAKGIANSSLVMKVDSKNIDKHINTISRQIEVAKFLAECESSATPILQILPEILPFINEDESSEEIKKIKIPTLFGSYYERVQLSVLAIVCGNNVEDGFGIAFRIIHDHKLNPVKVYCQAGKQLAKSERYTAIAQLVSCIKSSGSNDTAVTDMCDEMLILAIQTLTKANASGPQLDGLIKLITDRAAKISAYIESKQLKTAYLLAVKHKRMGDIRRILREAEFLNQPNIKALCQKILHSYSHSPSHSKD